MIQSPTGNNGVMTPSTTGKAGVMTPSPTSFLGADVTFLPLVFTRRGPKPLKMHECCKHVIP